MKTQEQTVLDYQIAVHELAHSEICSRYGIYSIPKVLKTEERYPETSKNDSVVVGTCTRSAYQKKEVTNFQQAVLSWAGPLMENIAGIEKPTLEFTIPLNAKNLKECFNQANVLFEKMSISDQLGICKFKRSYWKTFKRAWQLLYRKKK